MSGRSVDDFDVSPVLKLRKNDLQAIKSLVGCTVSNQNLLYLASRDGWGAEEFFAACEGKEKLLVLASSRAEPFVEPGSPWGPTHLFGGFSEVQPKTINPECARFPKPCTLKP